MADGRHLNNAKYDISATVWSVLIKFGLVVHAGTPYNTVYQKFKNFKIEDDRQWPYWKLNNHVIPKTVQTILMQFCKITHLVLQSRPAVPMFKFLKSPRWWTAAILKKNLKCYVSVAIQLILMQFV